MNLTAIYRGPNSIDPPRMVLTVPPICEPLTLAEAKLFLRLPTSITAEDSLITALISAARMNFERWTGFCTVQQSWSLQYSQVPTRYGEYGLEYGLAPSMTRFLGAPNGRELILPRSPLISVDSVKYLDETGTLQVYDPSNYTAGSVGADTSFGRIWLNDATDWPDLGDYPNALQINFTVGKFANLNSSGQNFASQGGTLSPTVTQASISEDIKMALRWLVAHYYENRIPVGTGDTLTQIPLHLATAIEQFRVAYLA